MKLKCINKDGWVVLDRKQIITTGLLWWKKTISKDIPAKGPKEGDIVTKTSEHWWGGLLCYKLLEWPSDSYVSTNFIPLEDRTDEMIEVSFTEIKKKVPISAN